MQDVRTLRTFITTDTTMRQTVFRRNPAKLATKTTEADIALKALDRLEARLAELEGTTEQPNLFTLLPGA